MAGKHAASSKRWTKYPISMHWMRIRNQWRYFNPIKRKLNQIKNMKRGNQ